jgi:predicted dehydrogenase
MRGMTASKIGIGIVGTGFGGSVQLPGFLGLPEARVIGIASKDSGKSEVLMKEHKLERAFGSWQELIDCPDISLVSVATPPFAHEEIVTAALRAKKHVLCEKPFTMSAAGAERMFRLAEERNVMHAIDFEFRELPAMQFLHKEAQSLGELQRASISWRVGTWADSARPWRWQCDKEQGGGVLGALCVHMFDAAEWLMGPIAKLNAKTAITIKERPDGNGGTKDVTAEDFVQAEMKTDAGVPIDFLVTNADAKGNGLTIKLEGSKHTIELMSVSQEYGRGLRVLKTIGNAKPELVFETGDAPAGTDARIPPFQSLAKRLLKAIEAHDRTFEPSFKEGMRAQMIRDAVLESSARSGWVDITEPAK